MTPIEALNTLYQIQNKLKEPMVGGNMPQYDSIR